MSQLQPNHLIMQQLHTLTHLPPLPVLCYLFPLSSYSAICYFSLPTLLSVPSLFLLCYLFLLSSYSAICSYSLPTLLCVPSLFLLCYLFLLFSFYSVIYFLISSNSTICPLLFLLSSTTFSAFWVPRHTFIHRQLVLTFWDLHLLCSTVFSLFNHILFFNFPFLVIFLRAIPSLFLFESTPTQNIAF